MVQAGWILICFFWISSSNSYKLLILKEKRATKGSSYLMAERRGLEPLHPVKDDGLAIRCITTLPTLQQTVYVLYHFYNRKSSPKKSDSPLFRQKNNCRGSNYNDYKESRLLVSSKSRSELSAKTIKHRLHFVHGLPPFFFRFTGLYNTLINISK